MTAEWNELQQELLAASRSAQRRLRADGEAVRQFKATVDNMRTFLWCYLQSQERNEPIEELLQEARMERAKEMLESVAEAVRQRSEEAEPAVRSFFEQVQDIALDAVERHCDPAPGGESKIAPELPASNP